MDNLHPGANLHTGCKFAPGCIFGHVNGFLRICTPGATGCKFAPTFEVEQIYFHPGAIVHMNAKCVFSIRLIYCRPFLCTIKNVLNDIKINLKLFLSKCKGRLFIMVDPTSK